jgi:hypothetical protein
VQVIMKGMPGAFEKNVGIQHFVHALQDMEAL